MLADSVKDLPDTLNTARISESSKPNMSAPDIPRAFLAEPPALTSQECQQKAAECLRLVRTLLDSTNKALMLEMAQAWIRLAEQQRDQK